MAHLILDIGNTRAKAAIVADGVVREQRFAPSCAELGLKALCTAYKPDRAIASIVGAAPDFTALLPAALCSKLHVLSSSSRLPITIDYDTPGSLGMDRIAAAVAAAALCPKTPLMVVDAGSCITIDFVDSLGCYHGGAILPGLRMRCRALHDYTAALPDLSSPDDFPAPSRPPLTGRSTVQSIEAGVYGAAVFEIQGFMEAYKKRNPGLKLFLTGGDMDFFANQLFFPNFAVSSLVVIGLDKILELNTQE